ncbi:MAG TPA: hypothetical protein VNY83_08185, partial [Solirubrobacterales bacterium]|nr:hypothetical protein [Solirubrobacterales bacterium]
KALTEIAHRQGVEAALRSPWLLVAAASLLAAFFCFQRALQTNRALTAIALMEAGANSSAILAGFVVFGDSLGASVPLAVLHALAFGAVGYAAWSLAPAQERLLLADGQPADHDPSQPPASRRLA